jgi:ABC-type multidrug transport system ATPase subunit
LIALDAVTAPRRHPVLKNASLDWGPGVHALVGAPADGGPLLLRVIAGTVAPRKGNVRVLEGGPTDAMVRARIAHVALEPSLPEGLRVHEVLRLAAELRRESTQEPRDRLAALGVDALAPRSVGSLSKPEARAVALAEALTSSRVRVLLIEEPFVALDPRAASRLAACIRACARDSRAVVIATASLRDASELADDHVLLKGGAVAGRVASLELLAGFAPPGARMRIVASQPHALLRELAREPGVEAIARHEGGVVVRGPDPIALAQAAARSVIASGTDVFEMRLEAPPLEEARAAAAGIAKATYDAAYARTRGTPPTPGAPEPERTP